MPTFDFMLRTREHVDQNERLIACTADEPTFTASEWEEEKAEFSASAMDHILDGFMREPVFVYRLLPKELRPLVSRAWTIDVRRTDPVYFLEFRSQLADFGQEGRGVKHCATFWEAYFKLEELENAWVASTPGFYGDD